MSTSDRMFEKVKVAKSFFVQDLETAMIKATKRNSKQPKWKHVTILLNATWRRDVSISELGYLIESRVHDSSWSVVFKALIVTHVLMDQGSSDRLIGYLATQPSILNLVGFRDASSSRIEQAKNITRYAAYLEEKVHVYRETKRDYCRSTAHTPNVPVESYGSMLRNAHLPTDVARSMRLAPVNENQVIQMHTVIRLFQTLLRTQIQACEIDNEVTLYAFRLLVRDLIRLYHVLNEGMINLLEHIDQCPKQIIQLFKLFIQLSQPVDAYLSIARSIPKLLIDVPTFKHIPDISKQLEEELNSGSQFTSRNGNRSPTVSQEDGLNGSVVHEPNKFHQVSKQQGGGAGGRPNSTLIDFFDTLADENHDQKLSVQQQQQSASFIQQQQAIPVNPFMDTPLMMGGSQYTHNNSSSTGTTQHLHQNVMHTGMSSIQQPTQSHIPAIFQTSMHTGYSPAFNPFAPHVQQQVTGSITTNQPTPYAVQPQYTGMNPYANQPSQFTGTNPYANQSSQFSGTNPFAIQSQAAATSSNSWNPFATTTSNGGDTSSVTAAASLSKGMVKSNPVFGGGNGTTAGPSNTTTTTSSSHYVAVSDPFVQFDPFSAAGPPPQSAHHQVRNGIDPFVTQQHQQPHSSFI